MHPMPPTTEQRSGRVLARISLAALLAAGVWLAAGCRRPSSASEVTGKRHVVCTIGMITDVAGIVGGDRTVVVGLMGAGVDPHSYVAAPRDMRELARADLILYNGLHLEGRLAEQLERLGVRRPAVAVTDGINPARLRAPPDFAGQYDPHVWFDVSLWAQATERIRDALIDVDPAGTTEYEQNAAAYLEQLAALHEETRARIAEIPRESRVLITAHDAFGYFGRAYDIEVRGLQGISTDSEASLRDVNDLVDTLVSRRIKAIFVESSVPRRNMEALITGCRARGHKVRIGGELYGDALGPPGTPEGTYIGMVRHNVNTIVDALR